MWILDRRVVYNPFVCICIHNIIRVFESYDIMYCVWHSKPVGRNRRLRGPSGPASGRHDSRFFLHSFFFFVCESIAIIAGFVFVRFAQLNRPVDRFRARSSCVYTAVIYNYIPHRRCGKQFYEWRLPRARNA